MLGVSRIDEIRSDMKISWCEGKWEENSILRWFACGKGRWMCNGECFGTCLAGRPKRRWIESVKELSDGKECKSGLREKNGEYEWISRVCEEWVEPHWK